MLIAPNGRPVTSRKRVMRVTDPRFMEYLSWGDPLLPKNGMTIVCQRCGGTPIGRNHDHDTTWTLDCDCTQWVWHRAAHVGAN